MVKKCNDTQISAGFTDTVVIIQNKCIICQQRNTNWRKYKSKGKHGSFSPKFRADDVRVRGIFSWHNFGSLVWQRCYTGATVYHFLMAASSRITQHLFQFECDPCGPKCALHLCVDYGLLQCSFR